MGRRGGVSSLLASMRFFLGNKAIRSFFKYASKNVCCKVDGEDANKSILYYALTKISGAEVSCPLKIRFSIELINFVVKAGVKLLNGDDKELSEALKIPGVKRGVESVLRSLAIYGVTVPQKLVAPFMIVWDFTNMCNFRCLHCYRRADYPLPNELTLSEKIRIVEELANSGVASVALSGGEPTLHPDYLTIVKALAKKEMYVAIATNGWRFASFDELKKAVEAGLNYVEVSVDSAYPSKHDEFRGVEGSWQRAVKALENAVKLGLSHAMAVTITRQNIDEVDDILDLAQSIGVKRVVFFNFIPTGRGSENKYLDLDPFEREEFMRRIYREMHRRKMEIYTTAPQYGRVVIQLSSGKEAAPTHFVARGDSVTTALAEFIGGCGAGRIYASIQPDGKVTPCVFLPITVGDLRKEPFEVIWRRNELLNLLRDRNSLKGFCGMCPYRNVCGGCRARAYAYFNDPLGPDPGCIYNLSAWRRVYKETPLHYALPVGGVGKNA